MGNVEYYWRYGGANNDNADNQDDLERRGVNVCVCAHMHVCMCMNVFNL